MRMTIIPVDKVVYVNGTCAFGLDLSGCSIPSNVHALQWYEDKGEVEYKDQPNEAITQLPLWANAAHGVWETAVNTPTKPQVNTWASFAMDVQRALNAFAYEKEYFSIESACTYVGSTNQEYKADADVCVAMRDSVWAAFYALRQSVEAGAAPMPTTKEELLAALPPMVWPQ